MLGDVEWVNELMNGQCTRLQADCLEQASLWKRICAALAGSWGQVQCPCPTLDPEDRWACLISLLVKGTTQSGSPSGHLNSAFSFPTALNISFPGVTTHCFPPFQNLHPMSSRTLPSIVNKFPLCPLPSFLLRPCPRCHIYSWNPHLIPGIRGW